MVSHHYSVQWVTKCPECPEVLHPGDIMFVEETPGDHKQYCATCYETKQRATAPKADLDIYMIDGHRVTYHPNPAYPISPWVSVDEPRRYSYLDVAGAYSVIYAPKGK